MKNGYTPKQYALTIAIDGLVYAIQNRMGELDDLTPKERTDTIKQMNKLIESLAKRGRLDVFYQQVEVKGESK